tara:strand:+ start:215 stop:379 length:165 start_codon:yes stop_codon:yes gene_type:complete
MEAYNTEKVQKYLDRIDALNDECENKIERMYQRRDKQVALYNHMILEEHKKGGE